MEPGLASGVVEDVRLDDVAVMRASVTRPERFEDIFEQHYQRIWRFLARMGGHELAEELASEVFLKAFARRDRFDPARGSVRSWLYGIASHLARTRFRSRARSERAFTRLAFAQVDEEPPTTAVEEALDGCDRLERVREALERLPANDREVLVLFVWERLSYEEIAAVLEIAVGTVRSRLARARARLRELAGLNGELTDTST